MIETGGNAVNLTLNAAYNLELDKSLKFTTYSHTIQFGAGHTLTSSSNATTGNLVSSAKGFRVGNTIDSFLEIYNGTSSIKLFTDSTASTLFPAGI